MSLTKPCLLVSYPHISSVSPGWGLHHLPGQTNPVLDHSLHGKISSWYTIWIFPGSVWGCFLIAYHLSPKERHQHQHCVTTGLGRGTQQDKDSWRYTHWWRTSSLPIQHLWGHSLFLLLLLQAHAQVGQVSHPSMWLGSQGQAGNQLWAADFSTTCPFLCLAQGKAVQESGKPQGPAAVLFSRFKRWKGVDVGISDVDKSHPLYLGESNSQWCKLKILAKYAHKRKKNKDYKDL